MVLYLFVIIIFIIQFIILMITGILGLLKHVFFFDNTMIAIFFKYTEFGERV